MLITNLLDNISDNFKPNLFTPDDPFSGIFTFDTTIVTFDTTVKTWDEV